MKFYLFPADCPHQIRCIWLLNQHSRSFAAEDFLPTSVCYMWRTPPSRMMPRVSLASLYLPDTGGGPMLKGCSADRAQGSVTNTQQSPPGISPTRAVTEELTPTQAS